MLALLYLVLIPVVGDTLARPILGSAARPRRLATAILAGFLSTAWLTYVAGYLLRDQPGPLDQADVITIAVGVAILLARAGWMVARRARAGPETGDRLLARPDRSELLDWALIAGMTIFVAWMMAQTYSFVNGELRISGIVWSDFGPTTAISQSFALGRNFPTEYPHFADFPILYHFLYYFQVGNLTHLGFDPALANNILSTATLVSMLVLVMALGRVVFRSPEVGRIGALLFFVHGSLSWVGFVREFSSLRDALTAIWTKTGPLVSGFAYRGEEWGIWTLGTFLNQRHLAGAIGILLLGVLFVIDRNLPGKAETEARRAPLDEATADHVRARQASANGTSLAQAEASVAEVSAGPTTIPTAGSAPEIPSRGPGKRGVLGALDEVAVEFQDRVNRPVHHITAGLVDRRLLGYVLVGFLLGMLPMWNSPVFLAAAVVLAVLFVLLPNRAQMSVLAVAAGSAALPQLVALRPAGLPNAGDYPTLYWGYTVDNPTITKVAVYIAFTFGPKLLLALVAVLAGTGLQRKVFLAFTALVGVAFGVQFSPEVFANHKFLNVWLIVLNLFAAAGMIRLWRLAGPLVVRRVGRILGRAVVLVLVVVIVAGGIIDLMRIKNTGALVIRLQGDRLFDWVVQETKPTDVFLTDLFVTHPILLAGRKIYYGWTYYSWGAGYPVGLREQTYKEILGGTRPSDVVQLLQHEGIAYVAIDDGMRGRIFVPFLNEPLLAGALKTVFVDPDNKYGHLVIYRVPEGVAPGTGAQATPGPTPSPVMMSTGGRGANPGEFADPRGIAILPNGEVLVADSGNHRIERFAPDGRFLASFGGKGDQPGRFNEPGGVAVGSDGHLFVADTANQRIQEFDASFNFVRAWSGPEPGFSGPCDMAVGPDGALYILDSGHARVIRMGKDGKVSTFGAPGSGAGQLSDPTGLAVFDDRVYVADPTNSRIQAFAVDGRFDHSILIAAWTKAARTADVAVSPDGNRLYASSPTTDAVLVISLQGVLSGTVQPAGANALARPGSLVVRPDGQILAVSFDVPRIVLLPQPEP